MMQKRTFLLVLSFLLCATISAQPRSNTSDVLFILDASGSMWQKLDGEFKIVIAKNVLQKLVGGLPDNTRCGLIVYGHNRKSDCSDIETLIPIGPLDKKLFAEKLNGLNPTGMTPIAKSIDHALAILKKEPGAVNCVLVSDGLETCDGDACALVKQAKTQGIPLTMHVIGFGLAEADLSALECIAQAGGGQYLPANNAEELGKALEKTLEQAPAEGGYLSVKVSLDGQLKDAAVKVFKKGETKELVAGRTYEGASTNPRIFLLPAGTYTVEASAIRLDGNPVQTFQDVQVMGPDTTSLVADFSQVTVEVLVTRNGELSDAVVQVIDPATNKPVAQGRTYRSAKSNPAVFKVIPGNYRVEIKGIEIEGAPVHVFEKQELASGAVRSVKHDFASGELKIGARQGSTLIDATVNVYDPTSNKNIAGGRTYTNEKSNPRAFTLEPGTYKVVVKSVRPKDLGEKTFTVQVKANGLTEQNAEW